jgi:hypothetical protein
MSVRSLALRGFGVLAGLALGACGSTAAAPTADDIRPRANPVEYVGLTIERPIASEAELTAFLDPLFGEAAAHGAGHQHFELQPGVFLTVDPDPRTAEQVAVRLEMMPARPTADTVATTVLHVPVSLGHGSLFLEVSRAALARVAEVVAAGDTPEPFHLDYRSTSPNGGELRLVLSYATTGTTLSITTNTPRTSLLPGDVNTPAFVGEPYEVLGGTVYFSLSRDEFTFFSDRAYGITSGAAQNFRDFHLQPHDWLRLTVTPQIEDELVNVAFDVITVDGRRLPFASAPASLVGGAQFQQSVLRMVDNMLAQEAATPGSSTRFQVPFYYDDPEGGGVVSVIAFGEGGEFHIAYAVESPVHRLQDVAFLPFQTHVDIPDMLTPPTTTCADIGSTEALRGRIHVRFDASTTVRESTELTDPLRGDVFADIFRAEDVTLSGPIEGAVAVGSFHFPDVDITAGASVEFLVPDELPVGDYQILGFMDIDGNGTDGSPDVGDPVTLPIGGYTLSCADQPVNVEFALLLPPGR